MSNTETKLGVLVGREAEVTQIDRLLSRASERDGGAILFRGEPGIGKTALLRYAASRAKGFLVLHTNGVETESEIAYAGAHELLLPILNLSDGLPERQSGALRAALGIAHAPTVDRLSVYAGVLGLLAIASEQRPVLALIDDAHWLDQSSTDAFLFTARRVGAERIAVLLAARDDGRTFHSQGIDVVALSGLTDDAAARLIETRGSLGTRSRRQLITVSRGNPLALIELASVAADLDVGTADFISQVSVGPRIQEAFLQRLRQLSATTRRLLLIVAASASTSLDVLADALPGEMWLDDALTEAESAGLIEVVPGEVRFRHPLVRASAYGAAQPAERRAVHAALAVVFSTRGKTEAGAWHRAAAALEPDEETAATLYQVGSESEKRGALGSAAAAYARSASLTPDPPMRGRRLLAASEQAWLVGRTEQAQRLLEQAIATHTDPTFRADASLLQGRIMSWAASAPAAHDFMVAEAARVAGVDPNRAAVMMSVAVFPAFMAGNARVALATAKKAVALAEHASEVARLLARIALGGAHILHGETSEGHRMLRASLDQYRAAPSPIRRVLPLVGFYFLVWVDDCDPLEEVLLERVESVQDAVVDLPQVLAVLAELEFRRGSWPEAHAHAFQALQISREAEQHTNVPFCLATLARLEAVQGLDRACQTHVDEALALAGRLGGGSITAHAGAALGLLHLGLGRVDEAVRTLETVRTFMEANDVHQPSGVQWLPDLIEAQVQSGHRDKARANLETFEREAQDSVGLWTHVALERCRGLLAVEQDFGAHFQAALARAGGPISPFEVARTALAFGASLRRSRRRAEAREHLRSALSTFETLGARPWAERARSELQASGERTRRRNYAASEKLTPQELQVALKVVEGTTNRETAGALFLSEKTIEFHLGNIYRKLGIRSRTELARRLLSAGNPMIDTHDSVQASPRMRSDS